jgi:tetratricopeptide (TPR) repeat protein
MIYPTFLKSKLSILVATVLVLTGCGGTGTKTAQGPSTNSTASGDQNRTTTPAPSIKAMVAEPGLTPRERLTKAINKLEDGESEIALLELKEYSEIVPNSSIAANLIKQITMDSKDYYPADFFTVQLSSGQSLSTLAKQYLGSALEFYALAKYNDISNPSLVNIGTDIKVPLTQIARSMREKLEAEALAEQSVAENMEEATNEAETIEGEAVAPLDVEELVDESAIPTEEDALTEELISEQIPSEVEVEIELPEATADSLIQDLVAANAIKDYAESLSIIESLKGFGPIDADSKALVLEAFEGHVSNISEQDPVTSANLLLEIGQMYMDNGEEILAFDSYRQATILDSSNNQANTQMLAVQKSITEKYHREASTAFRQQELAEAIEKWDVVLAVDPNHSNAMAYRTQAIELKERLDRLKGN